MSTVRFHILTMRGKTRAADVQASDRQHVDSASDD
jgi:hypothetical protein